MNENTENTAPMPVGTMGRAAPGIGDPPVHKEKKTVVDEERKAGYVPTRAASGAKSLNNGDPVAVALAGLTLIDIYVLACALLGFKPAELKAKYAARNAGMQRMIVGNRIRAAVKSEKEGTPSIEQLEKLTAPMHEAADAAAKKAEEEKEKAKEEKKAKSEAKKAAAGKKAAAEKKEAAA